MCNEKSIGIECKSVKHMSLDCEDYSLEYDLLKSVFKVRGRYLYSISVSISDGVVSETKLAHDITRLRRRALEIFDIFTRNTVTPCTLFEILSDIL